jgi:hypothetical protein
MTKITLAQYIGDRPVRPVDHKTPGGPFVTISRQYGCGAFYLGQLLVESLNKQAKRERLWKIYNKYILKQIADETNITVDMLDNELETKSNFLLGFLRSLSDSQIPSQSHIRHLTTLLIRKIALYGNAVIIGQAGVVATVELPRGLAVRLEAPEEWRIEQVAARGDLNRAAARELVRRKDHEREYVQKIYQEMQPNRSAFHVVYDCSVFDREQIAQQIIYALKLKGYLEKA